MLAKSGSRLCPGRRNMGASQHGGRQTSLTCIRFQETGEPRTEPGKHVQGRTQGLVEVGGQILWGQFQQEQMVK